MTGRILANLTLLSALAGALVTSQLSAASKATRKPASTQEERARGTATKAKNMETPENAPEPKGPSCQDTCIAEGWDAEECRLECTWVAYAARAPWSVALR